MRVDEKFNSGGRVKLLEVLPPPLVTAPLGHATGLKLRFDALDSTNRILCVHMTSQEALAFAKELLRGVEGLMQRNES